MLIEQNRFVNVYICDKNNNMETGCNRLFVNIPNNEKDIDRELQKIVSKRMKYTYVLAISRMEYLKISKYLGFMNSNSKVLIDNMNWSSDRYPIQWQMTFFTDIDNIKGVFEYIYKTIE